MGSQSFRKIYVRDFQAALNSAFCDQNLAVDITILKINDKESIRVGCLDKFIATQYDRAIELFEQGDK